MNKKEQYEAPLVECYEIKLERRPLMASPDRSINSKNHTEYLDSEPDGGDLI